MQGIKNDTLIGLTNKAVRKRGRDQPQVHKKLSKLKKKHKELLTGKTTKTTYTRKKMKSEYITWNGRNNIYIVIIIQTINNYLIKSGKTTLGRCEE